MSDVLQIALKRRNRLKAEITKLEEFLQMAEELSKDSDDEEEGLTLARSASAPVMPKPAPVASRPAANGSGSA